MDAERRQGEGLASGIVRHGCGSLEKGEVDKECVVVCCETDYVTG